MSEQVPHEDEEVKAPLSFKIMIVLLVLYLGWRLVQGIAWLAHWLAG